MPRKPNLDPRLEALRAKEEQAHVAFERWYGRLKRAFTGMEKAKAVIKRCRAAIRRRQAELDAGSKGT